MKSVAVVPALNEEATIAACVEALLHTLRCSQVIVVDDGSSDRTAAKAKEAGALVLRLPHNHGKGAALLHGMRHIPPDVDALLLVDADLGPSAARLGVLLESIAGGADVAIAQFSTRGGWGMAKRMATWGIARLTGVHMDAPLSGQRALSRRAIAELSRLPSGWGVEVAMTVTALWKGLRVVEVPVQLTHRETGRDFAGILHRARQCRAVVATLAALAWSKGWSKSEPVRRGEA